MLDLAAGLALSVFPALLIVAALSDVTTMTIPNRISIALVAAFVPAALLLRLDLQVILTSLGLGIVGLVLGMILFALRFIGGGDAKLIAASALWLGVGGAPTFLLWTAIAGGVFAVGLLYAREAAQPFLAGAPTWLARLLAPKGDIPYGVAIAIGSLAAFTRSPMFSAFHGVF